MSEVSIICCLCLLEIYTTLVLEVMSAITDVHHQAGLLLAYTQVLQMQDDADAVDIILRRRWRRTPRRSKFWVRVRQDEGRRLIHYRVSLATALAAI